MMQAFLVAVPRFADRFQYITAHFAKVSSMPFEIVGVDGVQAMESSEVVAEHDLRLSPGQVGCAMSHVKACERIGELGLEWGLVIEDDAVLPPDIDRIVSDLTAVLRRGEIISLYSPSISTAVYSTEGAVRIRKMSLMAPMEPRFVRTAAAYIVHRDAAAKIAAANRPVRFVADNFLRMHNEGLINHLRVLQPSPVSIKGFQSTIGYLKAGSLKQRIASVLNEVPGFRQMLTYRRRIIRAARSNNTVMTAERSPLADPNPAYSHPHG